VSEFEAKWTDGALPVGTSLLGTADIQSLADLSNAFRDVNEMRWSTVGPRLLTMMTLAAIVPVRAPLVVQIPHRRTGAEVPVATHRTMTAVPRHGRRPENGQVHRPRSRTAGDCYAGDHVAAAHLPPIEFEGHVLVDGGVMNNIPADIARSLGRIDSSSAARCSCCWGS
jgi:hypothetical protein